MGSPRIRSTLTLATTRLFRIETVKLAFSNGQQRTYERLSSVGPGAVLIVPMLNEKTVLLAREYAVGVERYELGLPKGRIEARESALEAANRELKEEMGYGSHRLEQLAVLELAPGYARHQTTVVLARDLYKESLPGDEPEAIDVVPWQMSRIGELIGREDCTEARSLAALFIAREKLLNE